MRDLRICLDAFRGKPGAVAALVLACSMCPVTARAEDEPVRPPEAEPASDRRPGPKPVAQPVPAKRALRLPAEVLARFDVNVPAEVAGKVNRRPDDDTRVVRRGEVVVTLNDRILAAVARGAEASLERAAARLEWAVLEQKRTARLHASGTIRVADRDRARIDLREAAAASRAAEAAVVEAKERLARTRIMAPFTGRLVRVVPERGEYIRAGETAFRLVDDAAVRVIAYASARVVGRLRVGQRVRVGAAFDDGSLGPAYAARLFSIAPAAEGQSRTFRVEARLKRPKDMRPGMAGYLELWRTDGDVSSGDSGDRRPGKPGNESAGAPRNKSDPGDNPGKSDKSDKDEGR